MWPKEVLHRPAKLMALMPPCSGRPSAARMAPEPGQQVPQRGIDPGVGEKILVECLLGGRQEGDATRLEAWLQLRGERNLAIREDFLKLDVAPLGIARIGADEKRRFLPRDPVREGVDLAIERIEQHHALKPVAD